MYISINVAYIFVNFNVHTVRTFLSGIIVFFYSPETAFLWRAKVSKRLQTNSPLIYALCLFGNVYMYSILYECLTLHTYTPHSPLSAKPNTAAVPHRTALTQHHTQYLLTIHIRRKRLYGKHTKKNYKDIYEVKYIHNSNVFMFKSMFYLFLVSCERTNKLVLM